MDTETRTVRIGRGRGCEVVLNHPSVSRTHAELSWTSNGQIEIRDLNSTGGTFVLRDGKEHSVTTERLEMSDKLRLGDYEIPVTDLLIRMGVPAPVQPSRSDLTKIPPSPPTSDTGSAPKTRMVRCECGTIKKRGEKCPACGE